MRTNLSLACLWLLLCSPAFADETVADMPQLMQLNRASQQELRNIQSAPAPADPALAPKRPWRSEPRSLDRQQQLEQGTLQENQRRELLMRNQRAKAAPGTGYPRRLDAIDRQSQFRMQQQNQLQRFRAQRGARSR